jgi:periplasmic divalent cation tolerance protein
MNHGKQSIMDRPDASVVMTTVPDDEVASRIASALVREGLAACVQRLPIRSTYAWQGRVEDASEVLLLIKTTRASFEALERRICEMSPYDVPEVIALDVTGVAPAYAAWLAESCKGTGRQ